MKSEPPFWDPFDPHEEIRRCDHPGCRRNGDFRAPKDKDSLDDYYYFCLEHVRAYNESWDFFGDLSPEEIEEKIRTATVWERPTWPLGDWQRAEEALREATARAFDDSRFAPAHAESTDPFSSAKAREALATLELQGPVDLETLKAHYRCMVKKYHPDASTNKENDGEKFKAISQAFAILRQLFDPTEKEDRR